MDIWQFNSLIVRPTLQALDLHSLAAERLILGTAAHESDNLRFIKQIGGGPALSFFQIEPVTADDVINRWLRAPGRGRIKLLFEKVCEFEIAHHDIEARLVCDMRFACAVARLVYYRVPEPLPMADDISGLASYWKRHYNTALGKGRVEDWINHYRRHVEPVFT